MKKQQEEKYQRKREEVENELELVESYRKTEGSWKKNKKSKQ